LDTLIQAHKLVRQHIGQALEPVLLDTYEACRETEKRPYEWTPADVGQRALKNTVLSYLVAGNPQHHLKRLSEQLARRHNMTDSRAAMSMLGDYADAATFRTAMDAFSQHYLNNPQVLEQWFREQAAADHDKVLERVQELMHHPVYDSQNPNMIRALLEEFAWNPTHFHRKDGAGYQFVADQVIAIDAFNPSIAASLAKAFSKINQFDPDRQALMKKQLQRIQRETHSPDVQDIVDKTLKSLDAK